MKYWVIFCFWFIASAALAKESLPAGCVPITAKGESFALSAKPQSLMLLHNLSAIDLWVTHPINEPSASAGFSSRLQADNWSALVVDDVSFAISCVESKPGHEQQISCADVLAVCQWDKLSLPKNMPGTYWAGEDMPFSELVAYIGRRGFLVPN